MSLSPAQIQLGARVPGGGCTCAPRPRSLQAVQFPTASSSCLVSADLRCPPPVLEVVLQDLKGLLPRPPLLGCVLVTRGVMFRLGKHHSDLQVLQALTGGGLPHGNTAQLVAWGLRFQDPSALLQVPLAVTVTLCCVLELHPSRKHEHPQTDPRS